ncbi:MAG: PAS domain-containing protein [Myxococcota bacterium]
MTIQDLSAGELQGALQDLRHRLIALEDENKELRIENAHLHEEISRLMERNHHTQPSPRRMPTADMPHGQQGYPEDERRPRAVRSRPPSLYASSKRNRSYNGRDNSEDPYPYNVPHMRYDHYDRHEPPYDDHEEHYHEAEPSLWANQRDERYEYDRRGPPPGSYRRSSWYERASGRRSGELRSDRFGRPLQPHELPPTPVGGDEPTPMVGLDLGLINRVSEEELHGLPYGLIVLNASGDILFYNETESNLAGFERERVTGKNFFREVAPCTRVKEFEGRFNDFVDGRLGRVEVFDFAFHFAHGTQRVVIALSPGRRKGQINVMLMRK